MCGGSILSSNVILTAAHCVEDDNDTRTYLIRAGSSINNQGGSVHWIRNFTIHENYTLNHSEYGYDVAMLRLENPIELDNITKKSITIIGPGEKIKDGTEVIVAGWGDTKFSKTPSPTEKLQQLKMKIVNKTSCAESWNNLYIENYNTSYKLKESMICAESATDYEYESTCFGDSGGPLVIDNKLVGILSRVASCTSVPYPNIFTEVSHFSDWIDKKRAEYEKEVCTGLNYIFRN